MASNNEALALSEARALAQVDKLRDAINGMRSDLDKIWNEYSPDARQEQKELASWAKDTMKRIYSAERMEPLELSLWNEDEYGQLVPPRGWFWNDNNRCVLVEAGWMRTRSERGDKLVGLIYLVEGEEGNHCEFLDLKGKPFTLAVK